MTPQEQELVEELFGHLAELENSPRDPAAERVIADGLRRAPQATYALVQTALVQDEALKRANARIEELQAQLGGDEQAQQPGSFLDNMRDAVLGRRDPRSSVPTVRSQAQSSSTAAPPPNPNAVGSPAFGSGGSFLGTAASTAAGVIGGGLLLNSIRSMFGQHASLGGQERSAFGSGSSYADMAEKQRDQDQDQDQDQDDQDQDDQDQDEDQDQDQDDQN
jgi:uncharacterized protein